MLTDKLWILIADSSEARIYLRRPHEPPVLVQHLTNVSDPNTTPPGTPASTGVDGETDRFAHSLAQLVERARHLRQFEALAIVAAPQFLGALRRHLPERTLDMVVAVVERRLTHEPIETIWRELVRSYPDAHP